MPRPYRQLEVWQRSQSLAVRIYKLSHAGKWDFYFRDQVCRAAFSVPANIAEGNERTTPADYAAFIDRSKASLYELDSWLDAASRLGLLRDEPYDEIAREIEELGPMLLALGRRLREKSTLVSRA